MVQHAQREHAAWSASASERLWACPGSLVLTEGLPDRESEAAAWGTACHQVAEKCLRGQFDAAQLIDTVEKTKAHTFTVDDEMAETAQAYIDYVRSKHGRLLIEQKFSLAALDPPIEGGGTGDAVILDVEGRRIEIVDLKGGRGVVVEALENRQLRTYALGAMLANPGPWQTVTVTIVQPRAPHRDGRIRSDTFDAMDVTEFASDLLAAMHQAVNARQSLEDEPPVNEVQFAEWAGSWLSPGDHCTFCKARPTCPALREKAMQEAHLYLSPQDDRPHAPPMPNSLTTEQLVRILDHADMVQNWLNAVRAYAQEQAEMGVEVAHGDSHYVLTPKRASRKWKGDDYADNLVAITGREPGEFLQEPKPMTPPMVEKLLGKKGYEAVKHLVVAESSGFNLTRADKTTRGAVPAPVHSYLTKQE